MNVITHALAPALLATPFLPKASQPEFFKSVALIGVAGMLPDLLHPHLSLASRYSTWTHSVFALGGFGALLLLARAVSPNRLSWQVAAWMWFAFALHMATDAVSGGIAPFQPASAEIMKPATRWIPYRWWWWCDGASILIAVTVWGVMLPRLSWRKSQDTGA